MSGAAVYYIQQLQNQPTSNVGSVNECAEALTTDECMILKMSDGLELTAYFSMLSIIFFMFFFLRKKKVKLYFGVLLICVQVGLLICLNYEVGEIEEKDRMSQIGKTAR